MKRVQAILAAKQYGRKSRRRGAVRQRDRRGAERLARRQAVKLRRWARRFGLNKSEVARMIQIPDGTLGGWERNWRENRMAIELLGRPAGRSSVHKRNELIQVLHFVGPHVGVPELRAIFHDMPRDEIRDLLQRYREVYIHEDTVLVHMLHWKRAGTVWAIDFTEPPASVDGIYPYIFTVRDLASKSTLLSLPVSDKGARHVRDALEALFKAYGAPLVLRSDNDKSFLEWEVQMLLAQNGTLHLLTPVYTPQYNGEVEAGAGSLKIHAHYEAARRGRPGEWTCDDVEAARLRANEVTRPWGHRGPGPEKVWKSRKRISRKLRAEFLKTAWACKKQVRKELRQQSGEENGRVNEATVSRRAICRALVAHGLLEIRRQGNTLPILARKCANI